MKILIAGGAGYIGSHVVRAILESGFTPVVYDNLVTGHIGAIPDAELVTGDIRDVDLLTQTLKAHHCEGVVHLAGLSLVGESMVNPGRYFSNNVAGGVSLLDAVVHAGVQWLVFSSTAAVYGSPETTPIPEGHGLKPVSPYGESKLIFERLLPWYEHAHGLRSVVLRYFNAAGAHPLADIGEDHSPESHVIPIVLQTALGIRECVVVNGNDFSTPDGTAIRDYVHVCDLASAHIKAIHRLSSGGVSGCFNLGSEKGYSVKQIVEAARMVTGHPIPIRFGPRRTGDPATLIAQVQQARLELGWTSSYGLNEIIESAWRWHSKNPSGYGSRS